MISEAGKSTRAPVSTSRASVKKRASYPWIKRLAQIRNGPY